MMILQMMPISMKLLKGPLWNLWLLLKTTWIHWHLTPWFGCINSWLVLCHCFRWSILFTNLCLNTAYLRTRRPRRPWKPAFAGFASWRKTGSWMFLSGCTRSGRRTQANTLIWQWSSKKPTSTRTVSMFILSYNGFSTSSTVWDVFPLQIHLAGYLLAGYLHQAGEQNLHRIWKAK